MRITSHRLPFYLAAVVLSFGLNGCGEPPGSASLAPDAVLRRGNGGEPGTLDPAHAEDIHAFRVLRDLYEGLVTEAADGSLVPGAASEWRVSEDGLTWTFRLRQGLAWSNGEPVTVHDFVDSFRRTLAPGSWSSYAFLLEPIRNARQYGDGAVPADDLGVRALSADLLEIELERPAAYFPGILAMPVAFPVPGGADAEQRRFADPAAFVGNGAYVLDSWSPGSVLRLKKNPHYRNASDVSIPAVEYFSVPDPATEFAMYRAGELHITATVPPDRMEALARDRPDELRVAPGLALYYLAFDLGEPPFDNPALRKALSLAVDRDRLVELIGRGELPAYGIVPDGVPGYVGARFGWRDDGPDERVALARSLLSQAGYDSGNPLRLTYLYDTEDVHETIALAVAAMWQDALPVEVAFDKREWQSFLAARDDRGAWQLMRFAWFGDYNDPSTFLDIFRAQSPQNLPHYRNPGYDSLLVRADATADQDVRAGLLRDAEAMLLADDPVVPLYFYVNKHLVDPRVRNFLPNALDVHASRHLVLADRP